MSNAAVYIGHGEMKRREAEAKAKAERRKVDSETRAARAAILEARQAKLDEAEAQAKAAQVAAPTALEAVLSRATADELAEISRSISRLDGRRLQSLVDEAFRAKTRTGYTPEGSGPAPVASSADVAEIALGAGESVHASLSRRNG